MMMSASFKVWSLVLMTVALIGIAGMPGAAAVDPPVEPEIFDPVKACGSLDNDEYFAQCVAGKVALGPIILPSPRTPDADEIALYEDFWASTKAALAAIDVGPATPSLSELKMFIRAVQSVVAAVNNEIRTAVELDDCGRLLRTAAPQQGLCQTILNGGDVPGPSPLPTGTDWPPQGDQDLFKDFVASPYLPLPLFGHPLGRVPHEIVIDDAIAPGGSHVTTKELFGLKLRLWYTWVPVWVEPWYSRRRIIGYKRRWFLRWVPCEYIKSIVHRSIGSIGISTPQIYAREFCDSRLLGYWRWFGH